MECEHDPKTIRLVVGVLILVHALPVVALVVYEMLIQ
jgi:phage shock protein PspC (stress-responsive transcriptional regulator)